MERAKKKMWVHLVCNWECRRRLRHPKPCQTMSDMEYVFKLIHTFVGLRIKASSVNMGPRVRLTGANSRPENGRTHRSQRNVHLCRNLYPSAHFTKRLPVMCFVPLKSTKKMNNNRTNNKRLVYSIKRRLLIISPSPRIFVNYSNNTAFILIES